MGPDRAVERRRVKPCCRHISLATEDTIWYTQCSVRCLDWKGERDMRVNRSELAALILILMVAAFLSACTTVVVTPPSASPVGTPPVVSETPPLPPSPADSPTATDSPSPPVSTTETSPSFALDADDFDSTMEMTVTREGMSEVMTGTLRVSDAGYAIYLLPDFQFLTVDDGDIIMPRDDSLLLPTILMKIVPSDGVSPLPEAETTEGFRVVYQRVTAGARTFDVMLTYPLEAAEGGAVLLHCMLDTLRVE